MESHSISTKAIKNTYMKAQCHLHNSRKKAEANSSIMWSLPGMSKPVT